MYKDLDVKIIGALQRDGRASLRRLAQEFGVATTTISNRLRELEKQGVIKNFKPVLNYAKLGLGLTAVILIKAKGTKIPEVVKELSKDERLTHVYEITGEFDILVIGKFRDQEDMNREIKRLLSNPLIEDTNTSVALSVAKEGEDAGLLVTSSKV